MISDLVENHIPLRKRVLLSTTSSSSFSSVMMSDTIYGRGFSKALTESQIQYILSIVECPIEIDFSERNKRGVIWAKYSSQTIAYQTILLVHQKVYHSSIISLRLELGVDINGKPIVSKVNHNTTIRHILYEGNSFDHNKKRKQDELIPEEPHKPVPSFPINYSHKSIFVNNFEIPFPTGLYLTRLLQLSKRIGFQNPLIELLTNLSIVSEQNKYSKEISEVMGMVDALERAIKLYKCINPADIKNSRVFVVGDGKYPLCAAALCLHFPDSWVYYSIDPILEPIDITDEYNHRFFQFPKKSQDVFIPAIKSTRTTKEDDEESNSKEDEENIHQEIIIEEEVLTIVIACHSHAPLQEFWDRIPSPKLAITMPCCSTYSSLTIKPFYEYEDYEIYSAKRTIKLYAS